MQKQARGISMMEVLIAITILGILTVAAIPYLGSYLRHARLQSAATALFNDFQSVRSDTIQRGVAATMVFQTGSSWCYGATTAATCNCATAGSCNLGQTTYSAYKNTDLSVGGFSGDQVVFNASRGDVDSVGSVTFTESGGDFIRMDVNKMGIPKLCSSGVGGYTACP